MKAFRAELHVHTVLSPCAEVEMIPPLIVQEALDKGIDILAITDHNSTLNVEAVIKAAEKTPLAIIPGVEIQTKEEIHFVCLFNTVDQLEQFQNILDRTLPDIPNQAEHFGEQFVVAATGEFIKSEQRLLINSLSLNITEAEQEVTRLNGLMIPAHIDRKMAGLIANLVFLPENIHFEVLEISRHITPEKARALYPQIGEIPLIQSGDVHHLEDFLGSTHFTMEYPSLKEIRDAIMGKKGYSFRIDDFQSIM